MRATALSILVLLAAAPAAQADGTPSANWAGYAIHGNTFQRVSGRWRVPRPTCTPGFDTYSAMWVGLGGYSLTSNQLEQVGTELDCTFAGQTRASAWYELVPAPSHSVSLPVRPGDQISASVNEAGGAVTVSIRDVRNHHSFTKTFHPTAVDTTSAEWILEAPSRCLADGTSCETLPLTDFGHASFWSARVEGTSGQAGTVVNSAWQRTKLNLTPNGQTFSGRDGVGTAKPYALNHYGGSFKLAYQAALGTPPLLARRLPTGSTYLRH